MKPAAPDGTERPERAAKSRLTRRRFVVASAGVFGLSATTTAAYASVVEPRELIVTRYAPNLAGWPAGRELTVTVVADLHAGGPDMTLPRVRYVVDAAQALRADLIVLLGDFKAWYAYFKSEPVADLLWAAELSRLKAPLGTWAILGNHDWWHDLDGVRSALARVRIPVLENSAVLLGEAGRRFLARRPRRSARLPARPRRVPRCRRSAGHTRANQNRRSGPASRPRAGHFPNVPARVALTLAGHTHGGQIRVPLLWPSYVPSRYGARYAYGHVVEDGRHLIVSGGLGTSIIPARLGVPPEIVHVTLGA